MSRTELLKTGAAVAALVWPAAAFAQPIVARSGEIEEVIVTAQRRAENLQDVPAAITALSGAQLARAGIENLNDVASRTPSFVIGQQGPSSPDISIRGIGSSDRDAGSERSVIVFVDEIYTGRAGGIPADLFDLERVEVLRGPQGTLYGKNTVGGAINLITAKPTHELSESFELTAGSRELFGAKGAIGGELNATTAGRIAFSARTQGPLYDNRFLNKKTDDYKLGAIRGELLWQPDAATDVLIAGDFSHDEIDGISTRIDPAPAALLATGFNPGSDPFDSFNNIAGFMDRDNRGASVRIDRKLSFGTLTSLSAYRSLDLAETRDLAGVSIVANRGFDSTQIMTEASSSLSQEIRLTSAPDQPLTWIGGLYLQREKTHRIEERKRQLNAALSRPRFDQHNTTTSYAVFGQATWTPIAWLHITAGGRYTIDKKDFSLAVTNPFGFASLSPATQVFDTGSGKEWKAFTPKLTVDADLNDQLMVYGTISRGFKSGGYQGLAANAAAARTAFNPEFATNYELGWKSQPFDRRLTLNGAGYYMDFKDLQFRQRILTIPGDQASAIVIVANAGTARVYGAELESAWRATDRLSLNLGYSYLQTKITHFNVTPGVTDVSGRDLARAPHHTFNAAADASWPLSNGLTLGARADYRYRSSLWFEPSADRALYEPGYGLVDLRLSLSSPEKGWSLEAWGRNVGDVRYRSTAQAIGFATAGVSAASARIGDPREAGVTFRWRR